MVYLIVFFSSLAFARWAQYQDSASRRDLSFPRWTNAGAIMVAVVLAGVSALRWQVGTDYSTYDRNFDSYVAEFKDGISFFNEPGIRFLAWISNSIETGSAGMFAIAAFLTVGLSIRTFWRWSVAFGFSVAVYILSGSWHGSFNGVRQYIAAAILLAGHSYIVERKMFRWLLVVLLASLFHISAVVGVLMYYVPRKRLTALSQLAIVATAAVFMVGTAQVLEFAGFLSEEPQSGLGEYAYRKVNPMRVAFECLPLVLYWVLPVRNRIQNGRDWFYANMLLIIAVTFIAGAGSAYITRFAIYPGLFLPLGLALITSSENHKERALLRTGLLVLMAMFMYLEISGSSDLRDFQWIFSRS